MPPVSILVALADPTRCRIIEILRDGPQPVRVLKQAKLISEKKAGRENVYRLYANRLEPVQRWIADMLPSVPLAPPAAKAPPAVGTPPPIFELVVPNEPMPKARKSDAISQMDFDF